MDKKRILHFGLLVFIGLLIWGPAMSGLASFLLPDAGLLTLYLLDKGIFVVVLLVVLGKLGCLKFFGFERGSSWVCLLPGMPLLLLGVLVLFAPDATFGLSMPATVGWILVALFVGISEETVFRGILWRAFEPYGTMVTALATSALFGAVHLIGLFTDIPWQIVVSLAVFAFGVGMMLAAVRTVSDSLPAPIALHTVFDAGALVAAGGASEMFDNTWTVERLLIPAMFFSVWGLACILIAKKMRSNRRTDRPSDHPQTGENAVDQDTGTRVW